MFKTLRVHKVWFQISLLLPSQMNLSILSRLIYTACRLNICFYLQVINQNFYLPSLSLEIPTFLPNRAISNIPLCTSSMFTMHVIIIINYANASSHQDKFVCRFTLCFCSGLHTTALRGYFWVSLRNQLWQAQSTYHTGWQGMSLGLLGRVQGKLPAVLQLLPWYADYLYKTQCLASLAFDSILSM